MNVVDAGDEPHYDAGVDCHGEVMARILEKLFRELGVDRVIEHLIRNVEQDLRIIPAEHPNVDSHIV